MRLAALAFAVSTAWPIATTAQVRDARPAVQAGTATIRGRVIAADGSRPLRRVQIRGTAPELTGPPLAPDFCRSASDSAGRESSAASSTPPTGKPWNASTSPCRK